MAEGGEGVVVLSIADDEGGLDLLIVEPLFAVVFLVLECSEGALGNFNDLGLDVPGAELSGAGDRKGN